MSKGTVPGIMGGVGDSRHHGILYSFGGPANMTSEPAVSLQSVSKKYGTITAVDDFSLALERGVIFGLLGPNGAGKTTLIRILTTLLRPSSGAAFVEGHNVVTAAQQVRRLIGVVPQLNNLDRYLTARENLVLHARMHGMPPSEYNPRIDQLLDLIGLSGRQNDFPDTFSGGMQRRLVVARALVHNPRVLFLDEPTTGLDPQSRRAVWEYIQSLRAAMTIFLTTHYMDEADMLCDRIVIMDEGRALVDGTASELKARQGDADAYHLGFHRGLEKYESELKRQRFVAKVERVRGELKVTLNGAAHLKDLVSAIAAEDLKRLCLHEPTLEDVFIELTGRNLRD